MKTILVSALALGAMTSVALATEPTSPQAGPVELTDAQMDGVSAGALVNAIVVTGDIASGNAVLVQVPVTAQVCALIAACTQIDTDALGGNRLIGRS